MKPTVRRAACAAPLRLWRGVTFAALVVTVACGDSPLDLAIKANDVDKVRAELATAAAANRRLPSLAFEYALWQLSPTKPETTEILKMLLESVPKADRATMVRATVATNRGTKGRIYYAAPVEVAAQRWSPDGVRLLLDNGVPIASGAVRNALVDAAANGCDPVITMLLDAGAAVNGRDDNNDSALAMARRVNNQTTVDLLLTRGARDQ